MHVFNFYYRFVRNFDLMENTNERNQFFMNVARSRCWWMRNDEGRLWLRWLVVRRKLELEVVLKCGLELKEDRAEQNREFGL